MVGKRDEVIKEAKTILRIFLIEQGIEVSLEEFSQGKIVPEEHAVVSKPKDTPSILDVPSDVLDGQQDKPFIDLVGQEAIDDPSANQEINDSGDSTQDPPKIEIIAEILVKEMGDVGKNKGDGKEGEMIRMKKLGRIRVKRKLTRLW